MSSSSSSSETALNLSGIDGDGFDDLLHLDHELEDIVKTISMHEAKINAKTLVLPKVEKMSRKSSTSSSLSSFRNTTTRNSSIYSSFSSSSISGANVFQSYSLNRGALLLSGQSNNNSNNHNINSNNNFGDNAHSDRPNDYVDENFYRNPNLHPSISNSGVNIALFRNNNDDEQSFAAADPNQHQHHYNNSNSGLSGQSAMTKLERGDEMMTNTALPPSSSVDNTSDTATLTSTFAAQIRDASNEFKDDEVADVEYLRISRSSNNNENNNNNSNDYINDSRHAINNNSNNDKVNSNNSHNYSAHIGSRGSNISSPNISHNRSHFSNPNTNSPISPIIQAKKSNDMIRSPHFDNINFDDSPSTEKELQELRARCSELQSALQLRADGYISTKDEEINSLESHLQLLRSQLLTKSKLLVDADEEIEALSNNIIVQTRQYHQQLEHVAGFGEKYNREHESWLGEKLMYAEKINELELQFPDKKIMDLQSEIAALREEKLLLEIQLKTDITNKEFELNELKLAKTELEKLKTILPSESIVNNNSNIVCPSCSHNSALRSTFTGISNSSSPSTVALRGKSTEESQISYYMYNGSLCVMKKEPPQPSRVWYLSMMALLQLVILVLLFVAFYFYITDFAPCTLSEVGYGSVKVPTRTRLTS